MKYQPKSEEYYSQCDDCGTHFRKSHPFDPDLCGYCDDDDYYDDDDDDDEVEVVEEIEQHCPICNQNFTTSEYLNSVFKDNEHARWIANMVTHYRHNHITSWDKMWGRNGYSYRAAFPQKDYDIAKQEINERAKRQIIRKATDYLIEHGFLPEHFDALQNTTEETMELARKKLGGQKYNMAS